MTENRTSQHVNQCLADAKDSGGYANGIIVPLAVLHRYKRMEEALASIQKSADTLGVDYEMYLAGIETEARHALAFDPLSL